MQVDREYFISRACRLYESWNNGEDETLSKLNSLVFPIGTHDEYIKAQCLQTWLMNVAILDTLMVMTKDAIYFLGSEKKTRFLAPLENNKDKENHPSLPPFHILNRNKSTKDKENFEKLIDIISKAGPKYGCFTKDSPTGDFIKDWNTAFKASELEAVDISLSISYLCSIKDEKEILYTKKSAEATVNGWLALRSKLVTMVDTEKKIKHSSLSNEFDKTLESTEIQGKLANNVQTVYIPIIQSGPQCSLKFSTESNDKNIFHGAISGSIGMRFMSYCTSVTRTLMHKPSPKVEENYEFLLSAQAHLISKLKPGAIVSEVYKSTLDYVKNEKPEILPFIIRNNFGFATGIEFRDSDLLINEKCKRIIKPNMVFVVSIGAQNFDNSKVERQEYQTASIWIGDTVLVTSDGPAEILTMNAKSRLRSNLIRIKEDEGDSKKDVKEVLNEGRAKRSVILQEQTRHKQTNEERRKEHQKELAETLNEAARARLANHSDEKDAPKVKKSNISYKSREKFPNESEVNENLIYVDKRHDTVILPIFGMPVPFHISMIKNTSMANEGDYAYLRINFTHPGSQIGKDNQQFANPVADFVKEMTFRSSNAKEPGETHPPSLNLQTAYRFIKDLQKRFKTQEAEEREKEGAVKQDKLIVNNVKGNPKLKDLFVRPNIVAKRMSGSLEAHNNGFRYTTPRGDKIDVLYNNIKHAFFQPCDNEIIILLHFSLKNPVLWGKKKYSDIQFFAEVGEVTTDLNKYHHMQDRDDIASEQMEREMRKKLNATFQNFCDKVAKVTGDTIEFDTPFNDLQFSGVPFRASTSLKPTSSCLVALTEWPPFVVALDEVELVHFERVTGNTKSFDMVIVFKDYTRKVQTISLIPAHSLDSVKDWLNSCDIRYSEGPSSLNWNNIMKTILEDPTAFFEDGGWGFLHADSDVEDEEDESDSSAFEPSDDEDESAEDESESDSDDSGVTESDSDEEGSLDSDESSGKDWSDLEEEAAKADKAKDRGEEEVSRGHKRKHGGGGGGSSSKKRR